jgi:hypothetical protein
MNTPRQRKRFDLEEWKSAYWPNVRKGSGQFDLALVGVEAGQQFALLITEFTHLEFGMERFLAALLRVDEITAAHVMRSIVSAKARIDMMRAVLERARHTSAMPAQFDEIINEFSSINKARNGLVHARWYTDSVAGVVYIIRPNDDPMLVGMPAMEEFDISQLVALRNRMAGLWLLVSRVLAEAAEREQADQ